MQALKTCSIQSFVERNRCWNFTFVQVSFLLDKIFGLGVTTPNLPLFFEYIPQFFRACIQAIALQFIVLKTIEKWYKIIFTSLKCSISICLSYFYDKKS